MHDEHSPFVKSQLVQPVQVEHEAVVPPLLHGPALQMEHFFEDESYLYPFLHVVHEVSLVSVQVAQPTEQPVH